MVLLNHSKLVSHEDEKLVPFYAAEMVLDYC